MSHHDRLQLIKDFLPGILCIALIYLTSALLRGIRSDFALELWTSLGVKNNSALFSQSEAWVMAAILLINGSLIFIKKNLPAFYTSLAAIAIGFCLLIFTYILRNSTLNPFWLVVLSGLGIYLPYLTITTSIFERLIAITKEKANVGFFMYIVDFIGYLGYNILLFFSNLYMAKNKLIESFFQLNFILGGLGIILTILSVAYFNRKFKGYYIQN